jgi:hypothetical protein
VGLTILGSDSKTCVGSRVHLVGVSISFEKNFFWLPFTPPSLVRRFGPSHVPTTSTTVVDGPSSTPTTKNQDLGEATVEGVVESRREPPGEYKWITQLQGSSAT